MRDSAIYFGFKVHQRHELAAKIVITQPHSC